MPDQGPQPHSELASFGEELRREREIRGISLKEIADATKISKRFLDAIERNDHKTLPAPVFTRGFVREYARYLGLSTEDIVNRYNYAALGDDRIEKSAHLERLTHPDPEPVVQPLRPKRGLPPAFMRIDKSIFIILPIIAALVGISYWAIKHKQKLNAETPVVPAPPVSGATSTGPGGDTRAPMVPATTTADPLVPADGSLRMVVEIVDDAYVDLEVDGKNVFKDVMKTGERHVFDAKEQLRFRTVGNAAGVSLTLNGVKLPALGRDGQVVKNRTFDHEYLVTLNQNTQGSVE
jgi:cytoskeleton protein RodZ